MEGFRIINFILQSTYLLAHFFILLWLFRNRQPTPIWYWFVLLGVAVWIWVSGRFLETIVYLFFPMNNDAYVFAANYQYVGNTMAVVAYTIWSFYIAGYDKLASNKLFQFFIFLCPIVVCSLVFTNDYHHLFYTKLMMGQQVIHGPLFMACTIWSYLILFAGYLVSIIHIIRNGPDKGKRLFMFSLFPVMPAIAVLLRSLTGIDRLDYTPIIMTVSFYCLYLIIFKYNYVNIIPSSIEAVLKQTAHPIGVYDLERRTFIYANSIALEKYYEAACEFSRLLPTTANQFEGVFDGKSIEVNITPFPQSNTILVTATDMSEIAEQQFLLDLQIEALKALSRTLEEENRNIDAYLGSLYQATGIKQKQDLITRTYEMIYRVFGEIEYNLKAAKASPIAAETFLADNLRLAKECITAIREAVVQLREV